MLNKEKCLTLLQTSLNSSSANFRENQWEAINLIISEKSKLLVVERTGWGKSTVYFLTTKILREQGFGVTLIVSPLLALMRNQIFSAKKLQINASTINSSNTNEWSIIENDVLQEKVDVLLISPERLANDEFVEKVLMPISSKIGMLVIDEAHCISDWGHDFRPDYKRINNILRLLPDTVPILATTATANNRVVNDIKSQIGNELKIQRGKLTRESIYLQCLEMPEQAKRLAWLYKNLPNFSGSGIVYVLTKRDAIIVSEWLQSEKISALPYFSGIKNDEFEDTNEYRLHLEDKLYNNEIKALIATTALGMGYDKPDLGFVIHYQAPASIIAYYQQVGRAGRGIKKSHGILLYGKEDEEIHDYFINNSFPKEKDVLLILSKLQEIVSASIIDLEKEINLKRGQIEKALKYLSVRPSPPVIKIGSRWSRTANKYEHDIEYIERIKNQKFEERNEVDKYLMETNCRMMYLANILDDPMKEKCGRCDLCLNKHLISDETDPDIVKKGTRHLKKSEQDLICRVRIPKDSMPIYKLSGILDNKLRASKGKILSRWNDVGWGKEVAEGKINGFFSNNLVEGSIELILERWKPELFPKAVLSVPSLNNPNLVESFSERLAQKLNLTYSNCIKKIKKNDYQKKQENSFYQFNNLDGVFEIGKVKKEPVLLVDDIVDSTATLTVLSALLLQKGVTKVYPFVLATTNHSGG